MTSGKEKTGLFNHPEEKKKEAAQKAKDEIAVGSEAILKDKAQGLKMEGGTKMSTQQSNDLKDVDDSLKALNKKETQKVL